MVDYSFDAARQTKSNTYDMTMILVWSFQIRAQFNEVNKLDNGETATLTFTYTISDGNGGTDTGDITITINGVNDTPIAVNDTNSVSEEGTITKSSVTSSNKELVTMIQMLMAMIIQVILLLLVLQLDLLKK